MSHSGSTHHDSTSTHISIPAALAGDACRLLGQRYDPMSRTCVPLPAPLPVVAPVTNPVCDWTSPFVCNGTQWAEFQYVSPAQFLSWDAPGCGLGMQGGKMSW